MAQSPSKYCPYCGGCAERYLSAETVATVLDCSVETVRSWIQKKQINSVKIGRLRRIKQSELDRIIEDCPSLDEFAERTLTQSST